jgi:hypothetical protein
MLPSALVLQHVKQNKKLLLGKCFEDIRRKKAPTICTPPLAMCEKYLYDTFLLQMSEMKSVLYIVKQKRRLRIHKTNSAVAHKNLHHDSHRTT